MQTKREYLVRLFTEVIGCSRCRAPHVLRDLNDNIPQPGWVGRNYAGLVFVGQNPGIRRESSAQLAADIPYVKSLSLINDEPSLERMHAILKTSVESFVYYRSFHFDVDIERVAYINAVRCRTEGNAKPERSVIFHCRNHFIRWLDLLRPRGVVYLGVFAERATKDLVDAREIPTVTISRQKNLTRAQRAAQMGHAMKLVSSILPDEGK